MRKRTCIAREIFNNLYGLALVLQKCEQKANGVAGQFEYVMSLMVLI